MVKHADLWATWRTNKDVVARDQLIETYLWLVRYVAGRMVMGLPSQFERDDLESYGCFGLIEAVDRFEPERSIRFETFAMKWIKGQILEGIRALQWAPALRKKVRQLEIAAQELELLLEREATPAELADRLGVSVGEIERRIQDAGCLSVMSMDDTWHGDEGEGEFLADRLADPHAVDPSASPLFGERAEVIAGAIESLTEQERRVISLFYYEGLTTQEVAGVLGVTSARISQVHSKAISRLRGKLSKMKAALVS